MMRDLSIIIPAYNEQDRIGGTVTKVLEFIQNEKLDAELIVVDDGSDDKTVNCAERSFEEYPEIDAKVISYHKNRGKGFAVKTGLIKCSADIALFSDADLSTPIEELFKLTGPIKNQEYDVTFGSRALDRSSIGVRQPWRREQSGKVFNLLVKTITGLPFWDTQCGFKAFNMKKFRPLLHLMRIERFGFDVEFLYVANRQKLKLKEISVRWNHDERTKVNVIRDSYRMFNEVLQIRKNERKGLYNMETRKDIRELAGAVG